MLYFIKASFVHRRIPRAASEVVEGGIECLGEGDELQKG